MPDIANIPLTAGDLMSPDVESVRDDLPLRDAAALLNRRGLHGAPVVDGDGRRVGVLSVTDLVRWATNPADGAGRSPTCGYQDKHREPGGREVVLCRLGEGTCPLQQHREQAGGGALACADPYSVPTDWQVVRPESLPAGLVREAMTTAVVTADPASPAPDLARLMLDRRVRRLVVVDDARRPVGVVSASDLLQVLAHPELAPLSEMP